MSIIQGFSSAWQQIFKEIGIAMLTDELMDAGRQVMTFIAQKLDRSDDELADMSAEEIMALLPASARREIRRMAREAQRPHEVRRPVRDSRRAYTSPVGEEGFVRLDNGLAVPFRHGRPADRGRYEVRPGDSLESIANRFEMNAEVLTFTNRGLSDELLRPGLILEIPLSGHDLRQAREAL